MDRVSFWLTLLLKGHSLRDPPHSSPSPKSTSFGTLLHAEIGQPAQQRRYLGSIEIVYRVAEVQMGRSFTRKKQDLVSNA